MTLKKKGFTLIELMITVTITLIILPVLVVLFISTNKNFIFYEASNTLKQTNQNSVSRIYVRLGRNKRLFENTIADNAFLGKADLSGCPSVMAGSVLASVKPSGSFSPSSANYDSSAFGNSLFFAYNIAPAIL
jgi:prepilin-type N-terminal cleavage/methylation domain-containing protein